MKRKSIICLIMMFILVGQGVNSAQVKYQELQVPNINSSFKSYMDYKKVTDKKSPQYKLINTWGWVDNEGFVRCNAETDLGITDDYYLIALGSYYGTEIGTKYRITTDVGNVFYGILADCKANIHTNTSNQYSANNNIVEMLVDTNKLNPLVKVYGTANVYEPLNGSIIKIERIVFVPDTNLQWEANVKRRLFICP